MFGFKGRERDEDEDEADQCLVLKERRWMGRRLWSMPTLHFSPCNKYLFCLNLQKWQKSEETVLVKCNSYLRITLNLSLILILLWTHRPKHQV